MAPQDLWTSTFSLRSRNLSIVIQLEGNLQVKLHNPRTNPTKAMMNIASAILGLVVVVYILLLGSDDSCTTPLQSEEA